MRLTRTFPILLAALFAVLLSACGGAQMASENTAPPALPAMEAPAAGAPAPLESGEFEESARDESYAQPASQRLVIKNASVSLQVESVANAEASIRARAEQLGGYVVSVTTSGSDEYLTSVIVFRVPAASFEDALSGIEGLARRVLSRSVSGEDVTEEFVDLGSRLRNLEATRDRLLELLEQATQVEDALQVNQALSDVQGEIEQIQGRMQYLEQSAALSTITAELRPVPAPPAIIQEDSWQPLTVAARALADLVEFGQGLVELAIVLAVWSPVWLPLLLLARWAWRRLPFNRGPRSNSKPPVPPAPDLPQA